MAPEIKTLLKKSTDYLKSTGSTSPRLDAELLLAEVLGVSRVDLYINFEQPLTGAEVDRYRELIRLRGKGAPVAYILGRAYFRNLTLKVDRSVLIPRPETEHLVEAALGFLMERDWPRPATVLDLGTGSGAIAIAITAAFPDAEIIAVDASAEAVELAGENARVAGVAARIDFRRSDMFDALDPLGTFDLIVSNPPYISDEEWDDLPRDIRDYEPEAALRGGCDGLDYYRLLAVEAPRFLRPGGCLALEIGAGQGESVTEALREVESLGPAQIIRDYSGHDRVVTVRRADG